MNFIGSESWRRMSECGRYRIRRFGHTGDVYYEAQVEDGGHWRRFGYGLVYKSFADAQRACALHDSLENNHVRAT